MGWVGSLVQGVSGLGAAMVNAAAARHAAGLEDKATQRAMREARLNEKTRHAEWEYEQKASEARYNAWQNARNKFLSEKLGFSLPYGMGGGGSSAPVKVGTLPETKGGTAAQMTGAQEGETGPEGVTLGQIAGVRATNEAPTSWNDWRGYNLG